MKANIIIALENGTQVVLDNVYVAMSEEMGVAIKERIGSFTPDLDYNGQYRACIKVWRGCSSYESFQARTEESIVDNLREALQEAAPPVSVVNGVKILTEGPQDDGKQPPLTREYLLSVVDDLWNKQQKLVFEPYKSLKRRYLLRLLYREILMRCVKRLQGAVVRHHCLNCPVVRQINNELQDSGYSIHYKAIEPHVGDFIHYKLLRNNGEILATVYGK